MENNQTTNYVQKPVYNGLLPQQEYEAVVVKAVLQEPKMGLPASIRVMFKIDLGTQVAFVSGFINQFFKSGDKTATWVKNLGIVTPGNQVPVDQLKGKRCKIYVVPGKKVWSQNLNQEIQYHKIMALTPISSVIPQVVSQPVQGNVITQTVSSQFQQPVVQQVVAQPMTQPVQNHPFMKQQPVQPVQPVQPAQPVHQPSTPSIAEQLNRVAYGANTVVQTQQPVQQEQPVVAEAVKQPLPKTAVSLDF